MVLRDLPELSSHRRLIVSAEGVCSRCHLSCSSESLQAGSDCSTLTSCRTCSRDRSWPCCGPVPAQLPPRGGLGDWCVAGVDTAGPRPSPGTATRGVYDVDAAQLAPLPLAVEEARFVGGAFGERWLTGARAETATEAAVKAQPLADYRILHLPSTAFSAPRSRHGRRCVLRPAGSEDGLLQAGKS